MTIKSETHSLATITSGATCLLIISLKTLGNVVVDDETHIRFVDTHTEGYRCHNDIYLLHQKVVLCLRACCSIKTGMIGSSLDIVGTENVGKILYLLAREAIDNTALALMLADKTHNILIHVLGLRPYLIVEVRTVERALEFLGVNNTKTLLDVGAHLVGGGSCESNHGSLTYLIDYRADTAILRAEIMSPLRYTVCLINSIE